ncbi:hypothetical protein [Leptospira santarosai]|uniref:Lipoprotein n=1 Tax=Leptospira santarosai TaxID=28183 RepID=A0AB73LM02_9LEPT|nr:hypothetical protein [Leptospira santarosai]AVV48736.1 Uncharacterized protein XB17_00113 [Leptospira santarosai]ONF92605.1 hypothetical protein BWD14_11785 [Leptospira santarosai]
MKFRILNLFFFVIIYGGIGCSIGTRTDACKADLKRDYSSTFCEVLSLAPLAANKDEFYLSGISDLILGCLLYYENIKECEKEGNRYTPALYSRE